MNTNPYDRLGISEAELKAFGERWRVRELALFGSVLRDDFTQTSDVDVLVSFQADAGWSLLDLAMMKDELETMVGRSVDIVERESLRNPFRRHRILTQQQLVYGS